MNTATQPPRPRRQVWPWVVGILLTPFVITGLAVVSVLQLNADAARLRNEIVAATGGGWRTQVQLTVNRPLVAAARAGLAWVHDVPAEARQALEAVHSASVGVYRRTNHGQPGPGAPLWAAADRVMSRHGWVRMVGVSEPGNTVLIYVPAGRAAAAPGRVCLAVCDRDQLVIVSGRFDADALAGLVAHQMKGGRLPLKL